MTKSELLGKLFWKGDDAELLLKLRTVLLLSFTFGGSADASVLEAISDPEPNEVFKVATGGVLNDGKESEFTAVTGDFVYYNADTEAWELLSSVPYRGTGNALPGNPVNGWIFKLNSTSAALQDAPEGSDENDLILYDGSAWVMLYDAEHTHEQA